MSEEKSLTLSDVLKAAATPRPTGDSNSGAIERLANEAAALNGYAPRVDEAKDAPAHGAAAHRNISIYGQALAKFLEENAEDAIREAEIYAKSCRDLADKVREMASSEADRAVRYTKRVRRIATVLDEAVRLHNEDI